MDAVDTLVEVIGETGIDDPDTAAALFLTTMSLFEDVATLDDSAMTELGTANNAADGTTDGTTDGTGDGTTDGTGDGTTDGTGVGTTVDPDDTSNPPEVVENPTAEQEEE